MEGRHEVIHYLDDFLLIECSKQAPADLLKLLSVFASLNVPLAVKKMEGPVTALTFFGDHSGYTGHAGQSTGR